MSHYDGPETEIKQVRAREPREKQANVKRVLKRVLLAATEEIGAERIVGLFCVTFTASGGAGLAYALTAAEAPLAAVAVPEGLERALAVVRTAAVKTAGSA